jgi:succinate-semialdehyde dehydrogenase / glutarate-semialdehyde dehydrogenase
MPLAARKIEDAHKTIRTVNPATGKALETYAVMTDAEMDEVVEATHAAFDSWRRTSMDERAEIVHKIAARLRARKNDIADMMSREMGKLHSASLGEIESCAGICEYTVKEAEEYLKDEERPLEGGGTGIVSYRPIGVIYGIQPWNFPFYQAIRYSICNIMAGNTVLLKHAENVTGSALLLEKIYNEAGLPDDVFNVLIIDHDQSDKVIDDRRIRGVTLTGSARAGAVVGARAGKALKKTVLELGSNDAYIVLEDADLDNTVKQCVAGRIYNNGETCVAAKRFIVVDAVYDAFRDAFVKRMEAVTMGDPFDKATKLGPIARKDLRDDLHAQVEKSIAAGATLVCGGTVPEGDGFFYPATLLENVTPGMPAYDEELFGPVASLIRAADEADAIRIANDSRFGLGGGIFSADVERARRLARDEFDTGMVFINGFGLAEANMPFGGVKDSGHGREHGGFGIREFVNVKAINIKG